MTTEEISAYKEQMFGNGQSNTQPPTPEPTPASPQPAVETPATPSPIPETPTPAEPPPSKESIFDEEVYLKENFGYDSLEAAKQAFTELKTKAETPTEIKFANDESKRLAEAIAKGKEGRKEALRILETQERLEQYTAAEVNDDTAADIIKLGMSLKYKDLSPKEIEYKFNKEFGLPKEPVQNTDELDEEFAVRKSAWQEKVDDIKMSRNIEAKLAKPELEKLKAELVFPEINKPQDQNYEQWKQQQADIEKQDKEVKEAYSKFSPKDIEMVFKFNDEASKLAFDINFVPDKESFEKAIASASDLPTYLSGYYDKDGNPDRTRFAKDLYAGQNIEKIVTAAVVQATNETKAWFLKNQKNIGDGTQRNFVLPPTTDIDKLKQAVFG